jgi:hypothetical protein
MKYQVTVLRKQVVHEYVDVEVVVQVPNRREAKKLAKHPDN